MFRLLLLTGGLTDSKYPTTLGFGARAYLSGGHLFRGLVSPERAHRLAVWALSLPFSVRSLLGLVERSPTSSNLSTKFFSQTLAHPFGVAAGFDKHAESIAGLHDAGFSTVEIGSVTPEPQSGNERPRVFRLTEDEAIINRYGFNSDGIRVVRERLERHHYPLVGVNLGRNKSSQTEQDYVTGVQQLGPHAGYLVINVSSPNTPGLRELQSKDQLLHLLTRVKAARDALENKPPLLVKIAPDAVNLVDITGVVLESGIDGIIVGNTTVDRPPSLKSPHASEPGGLSGGEYVMNKSTRALGECYRLLRSTSHPNRDKVVLIGVGGIRSGKDAYAKIRAGANSLQLYSSFVYGGPLRLYQIKCELSSLLKQDGFRSVSEAVGADHV